MIKHWGCKLIKTIQDLKFIFSIFILLRLNTLEDIIGDKKLRQYILICVSTIYYYIAPVL